jgi:arginase family enzyme
MPDHSIGDRVRSIAIIDAPSTWAQLTAIVQAALATGRARGIDLAIFNPTLDPDGSIARRLVRFLADCLA